VIAFFTDNGLVVAVSSSLVSSPGGHLHYAQQAPSNCDQLLAGLALWPLETFLDPTLKNSTVLNASAE
jgi:hypothetical protein